jgi:hypothetical protein
MYIIKAVVSLTRWILNPLRLIFTKLYAAPSFFSEDPGGCPPAAMPDRVHPSPPSKFPIKQTLQMVDYHILLLENKERLNMVLHSLETARPLGDGRYWIVGRFSSEVINNFCSYREAIK